MLATYALFARYNPGMRISALILAAEEVVDEGRTVNNHTFIGLGVIAVTLFVIWLIRRSRA